MAPESVLNVCWALGLTVTLGAGDSLQVSPAKNVGEVERRLLREHKPEILALLRTEAELDTTLHDVAMHVCDRYGDGANQRAEMARACRALPVHLKADLLDHFRATYLVASSSAHP